MLVAKAEVTHHHTVHNNSDNCYVKVLEGIMQKVLEGTFQKVPEGIRQISQNP